MKIPKARKLKSGTWFIQLRLGGESVSVTAPTESECKKQAALIKAEHVSGKVEVKHDDYKNWTLRQLMDKYIKKYTPALSPSTLRGYLQIKNNRFISYIDKPIKNIDFQNMINSELSTKSAKTVQNGWFFAHAALADVGIVPPKIKLPQVPINDMPFLQPEEIPLFCAAIKGRPYEIAALLELHGLRVSEVCGLTWDKIDLKRKIIHVRGAMVRGVQGWERKKTNKNVSSARLVPIMIPRLAELLRAVPNKSGQVVQTTPSNLYDDIQRACVRAGITVVGNHGLRHSFASLGYHVGLSERQLMRLGGWSDIQTMHKIYIKLSASANERAENALSDFFANMHQN